MSFYKYPEGECCNYMFTRITGLLLQEWHITRNSLEVLMDTGWFSALSVVVMGFTAQYISANGQPTLAHTLISGILWWEYLRINQYSLTLNPMWNIWSRNFCNMFISPITIAEYLIAQCIVAIIKSVIVLVLNLVIIRLIFSVDIFQNHSPLTIASFFVIFALFAWSIGLIIMGVIFRYGTRIQALAWGFIAVIQPLVAVFFPLSVMPGWLASIALFFPATYLFEINRALMSGSLFPAEHIYIALLQTAAYFTLSMLVFIRLFKAAQSSGQFAKNEEA